MTPDEVNVIRESFAELVPIGDTVATLFYSRLFEIDPDLAPPFAQPTARRRAAS